MATQAQVLANRQNALRSTGPRTTEGKSKSSANATKHGLSAAFRVLSNENQQEFDELIAEYHRIFAPTNGYEQSLVEEMAHARWRRARARRLEVAMIEQMTEAAGAPDSDAAVTAALLANTAGPLLALQRHAAAAERSDNRALQQLLALRRLESKAAEATNAASDAAVQNEPDFTPIDWKRSAPGVPCYGPATGATIIGVDVGALEPASGSTVTATAPVAATSTGPSML
jgi:hypothetical protein